MLTLSLTKTTPSANLTIPTVKKKMNALRVQMVSEKLSHGQLSLLNKLAMTSCKTIEFTAASLHESAA